MSMSVNYSNDDEAAQAWLRMLRDGNDDQKIVAREQLASIFERKGMYEEATELLISNVHDGVRSADIFRWLARLYRYQGQEVLAMQAAAEAAKYMTASRTPAVDDWTLVLPAQQARPPGYSASSLAPVVEPEPPLEHGECSVCGHRNQASRSTCKQCRSPLQRPAPAYQPRALNLPLALLVAVPLSWVASVIMGFLLVLLVGATGSARGAELTPWVVFGGWIPVTVIWVYGAATVRRVARRALKTLTVACFAMPAVGLIFGLGVGASTGGTERSNAAMLGSFAAGGMMAIALGCVGFTFGIMFLVAWLAIRRDSADE